MQYHSITPNQPPEETLTRSGMGHSVKEAHDRMLRGTTVNNLVAKYDEIEDIIKMSKHDKLHKLRELKISNSAVREEMESKQVEAQKANAKKRFEDRVKKEVNQIVEQSKNKTSE